ncbi:hypothetical protein AWM68_13395 [Fictibacillus phosphorivorans]|uniref:Uncharacterized protein n=1 Tax=Fictibacillus phosphorivorans TaxID=1221500 RepID=A0A163PT83_9BACL|nr:hypothetical protein AWM68_13395 [Fictibacillus phosphorivorans]
MNMHTFGVSQFVFTVRVLLFITRSRRKAEVARTTRTRAPQNDYLNLKIIIKNEKLASKSHFLYLLSQLRYFFLRFIWLLLLLLCIMECYLNLDDYMRITIRT